MDFIFILIMFLFAISMLFDMAENTLNKEEIKNDPIYRFFKRIIK